MFYYDEISQYDNCIDTSDPYHPDVIERILPRYKPNKDGTLEVSGFLPPFFKNRLPTDRQEYQKWKKIRNDMLPRNDDDCKLIKSTNFTTNGPSLPREIQSIILQYKYTNWRMEFLYEMSAKLHLNPMGNILSTIPCYQAVVVIRIKEDQDCYLVFSYDNDDDFGDDRTFEMVIIKNFDDKPSKSKRLCLKHY